MKNGSYWRFGLLLAGLGPGAAGAQTPATPAPAKPLAFDVISIRQDTSNALPQMMGPSPFGPTADGYRLTNLPLALVLLTAYVPQSGAAFYTNDHVKGLPDWAQQERYDIVAKVGEDDLAEWQKPSSQAVMLPAMLQSMMADRCKLVVHRESKELPVYLLVVGKNGPKFKETDPSATPPAGMKLPWGGVVVPSQNGLTLYGATMESLATLLSQVMQSGRPIQDKTGLTGKYDLVLKPNGGMMGGPPPPGGGGPGGGGAPADPGSAFSSVIDDLGLKLDSGKAAVETLVVDHMDRPSSN